MEERNRRTALAGLFFLCLCACAAPACDTGPAASPQLVPVGLTEEGGSPEGASSDAAEGDATTPDAGDAGAGGDGARLDGGDSGDARPDMDASLVDHPEPVDVVDAATSDGAAHD
jgi:hypothetical protein